MSSRFTVVVPTRGDSAHLRAAVASVLASTVPFELLLVHDRRQGEPALPAELGDDPRIRLLSASRPGPAAARNAGLSAASSERIAFLDDDDLWTADHLERAGSLLDDDEAAVLACGDAWIFDDRTADGDAPPPAETNGLRRFAADERLRTLGRREMLLANRVLTPTVVIDLVRAGTPPRFDESLPVMEDYDLWLRLQPAGGLLFDPQPTTFVRRRPGSASRRAGAMAQAALEVVSRHERELEPAERDRRLGGLWNDLAWARLVEGHAAEARTAALRSRRFLPGLGRNYAYVLASFLPGPLRAAILAHRRRARRAPVAGQDRRWVR